MSEVPKEINIKFDTHLKFVITLSKTFLKIIFFSLMSKNIIVFGGKSLFFLEPMNTIKSSNFGKK